MSDQTLTWAERVARIAHQPGPRQEALCALGTAPHQQRPLDGIVLEWLLKHDDPDATLQILEMGGAFASGFEAVFDAAVTQQGWRAALDAGLETCGYKVHRLFNPWHRARLHEPDWMADVLTRVARARREACQTDLLRALSFDKPEEAAFHLLAGVPTPDASDDIIKDELLPLARLGRSHHGRLALRARTGPLAAFIAMETPSRLERLSPWRGAPDV